MIFGDKSYFNTYFRKMLWIFFKTHNAPWTNSLPLRYVRDETATKLDCYKNVSDNIFFHFFLHKSINNLSPVQNYNFFFLIQDFYSLIAKFINDVTDFEKKKINYLFQYKKWLWTGIFFTFITVLGMSKIRKNIGFDAFLVFEQDQIYIFSPSFTVRGCFCPIDFHYNYIFDCKAMTHIIIHFWLLVVFPVGKR